MVNFDVTDDSYYLFKKKRWIKSIWYLLFTCIINQSIPSHSYKNWSK